jgi:hypothetical protein
LALSVRYYHKNKDASKLLTDYVIQRLINENQIKINKVIDNLGPERFLLQHLKGNVKDISYEDQRKMFKEIMENKKIIHEIKRNIHVEDNILEDLENVNSYDKTDKEYAILKNKVINVGEFEN